MWLLFHKEIIMWNNHMSFLSEIVVSHYCDFYSFHQQVISPLETFIGLIFAGVDSSLNLVYCTDGAPLRWALSSLITLD